MSELVLARLTTHDGQVTAAVVVAEVVARARARSISKRLSRFERMREDKMI